MQIIVEGTVKEIADLIREIQDQSTGKQGNSQTSNGLCGDEAVLEFTYDSGQAYETRPC